MSDKIELKEKLAAVDLGARDFWAELTDDQKKEFVMLIGIYQHHMKFLNQQECGNQKSSCSNKKVCNHDTKKASIKEIPLIPRH